jgi:hypothetical protein
MFFGPRLLLLPGSLGCPCSVKSRILSWQKLGGLQKKRPAWVLIDVVDALSNVPQ